jgi:hypothetical protein
MPLLLILPLPERHRVNRSNMQLVSFYPYAVTNVAVCPTGSDKKPGISKGIRRPDYIESVAESQGP